MITDAKPALVGIVVADMARSLAFYRLLGLDIPTAADAEPHVDVALPGGLRLAFDTEETIASFHPAWKPGTGGGRVSLAFALPDPAAREPGQEARKALAPVLSMLPAGVTDTAILAGLMMWSALLGTISLELFGQFHNVIASSPQTASVCSSADNARPRGFWFGAVNVARGSAWAGSYSLTVFSSAISK